MLKFALSVTVYRIFVKQNNAKTFMSKIMSSLMRRNMRLMLFILKIVAAWKHTKTNTFITHSYSGSDGCELYRKKIFNADLPKNVCHVICYVMIAKCYHFKTK